MNKITIEYSDSGAPKTVELFQDGDEEVELEMTRQGLRFAEGNRSLLLTWDMLSKVSVELEVTERQKQVARAVNRAMSDKTVRSKITTTTNLMGG